MLLIDEAEIDENGVAHCKYTIKDDEFFCRGHFPGNPIVPGVIQCEIMAQSCAVLVKDAIPGHLTFYAGIDKVRFKNLVKPGDVVRSAQSSTSSVAIYTSARPNLRFEASFAARATSHLPSFPKNKLATDQILSLDFISQLWLLK